MAHQLLALVKGHGLIIPQETPYRFETAPPLRVGDECRIVADSKRVHCVYISGKTGSAGVRGWLVEVSEH